MKSIAASPLRRIRRYDVIYLQFVCHFPLQRQRVTHLTVLNIYYIKEQSLFGIIAVSLQINYKQ